MVLGGVVDFSWLAFFLPELVLGCVSGLCRFLRGLPPEPGEGFPVHEPGDLLFLGDLPGLMSLKFSILSVTLWELPDLGFSSSIFALEHTLLSNSITVSISKNFLLWP